VLEHVVAEDEVELAVPEAEGLDVLAGTVDVVADEVGGHHLDPGDQSAEHGGDRRLWGEVQDPPRGRVEQTGQHEGDPPVPAPGPAPRAHGVAGETKLVADPEERPGDPVTARAPPTRPPPAVGRGGGDVGAPGGHEPGQRAADPVGHGGADPALGPAGLAPDRQHGTLH